MNKLTGKEFYERVLKELGEATGGITENKYRRKLLDAVKKAARIEV